MSKKKNANHYVDNERLFDEMTNYWNSCREAEQKFEALSEAEQETLGEPQYPRVSEYIGECIVLIATNLGNRPNFMNYDYLDDMVGDAIENSIKAVRNFNPDKSTNPFAYFTQICWYAFLRRIQQEKKQQWIKYNAITEIDRRGTFEQWAKSNGWDANGAGQDAYADYLKLSSQDIENFDSQSKKKRGRKKKPKTDEQNTEEED